MGEQTKVEVEGMMHLVGRMHVSRKYSAEYSSLTFDLIDTMQPRPLVCQVRVWGVIA